MRHFRNRRLRVKDVSIGTMRIAALVIVITLIALSCVVSGTSKQAQNGEIHVRIWKERCGECFFCSVVAGGAICRCRISYASRPHNLTPFAHALFDSTFHVDTFTFQLYCRVPLAAQEQQSCRAWCQRNVCPLWTSTLNYAITILVSQRAALSPVATEPGQCTSSMPLPRQLCDRFRQWPTAIRQIDWSPRSS